MAFVLAVGVDPAEQGGLRISSLIAVPARMTGEGAGKERPVMFTSVEGPSLMDAFNLMDSYIDRQVSFAQTSVLIWGEDLARRGIAPFMDPLARLRFFRRDMRVMVAQDRPAAELLQDLESIIEADPARYLEQFHVTVSETGVLPRLANLHQLLTGIEQPGLDPIVYLVALRPDVGPQQDGRPGQGPGGGTPAAAGRGGGAAAPGDAAGTGGNAARLAGEVEWFPGQLPRQGGPNAEVIGAAVFRGGRMVGEASGQDVRLIHMLRGSFDRTFYSAPDPAHPASPVLVLLKRARSPAIRVTLEGARPRIRVRVPLEAELAGVRTGVDYTQPSQRARLEAAIAADLAHRVQELVARTQQEWQADPFGFGARAARLFSTTRDWQAYDWDRRWPDARVQADFSVTFRRFGTQLGPSRFGQEPAAGAASTGGDQG